VDVYAFSMIAFELFEGWAPFLNLHPVDAARRAALHSARPQWGKVNRCGAQPYIFSTGSSFCHNFWRRRGTMQMNGAQGV